MKADCQQIEVEGMGIVFQVELVAESEAESQMLEMAWGCEGLCIHSREWRIAEEAAEATGAPDEEADESEEDRLP